jgi:hypothetical protein
MVEQICSRCSMYAVAHKNYSVYFHRKNLRKPPENLWKPPENFRIIPEMAENYGNPTVFLQPTNRKHILLNGQFGLASSDYMYGIQRLEFSQCTSGKFATGINDTSGEFATGVNYIRVANNGNNYQTADYLKRT